MTNDRALVPAAVWLMPVHLVRQETVSKPLNGLSECVLYHAQYSQAVCDHIEAGDAMMHGQHPQATLQLPKAIGLTDPDSESLLLEHAHPVVAAILLLQHHGVLGR